MPRQYYNNTDHIPSQYIPIIDRIQYYICGELLYKDENYVEAKKRFIMSDITTNQAGRGNLATYNNSNLAYPFTAWNIGDPDIWDGVQSHNAKSFNFYAEGIDAYISAIPTIVEFPMISFFTMASDYEKALKILRQVTRSLLRLFVPIVLNGVTTQFPINIEMEVTKGEYSFEFEQWLVSNRMFDINHTMRIKFWDFMTDAEVNKVDDIEYSVQQQNTDKNVTTVNPLVTISSTIPVDESEGVALDTDITINFSDKLKTQDFKSVLMLQPYFDYDLVVNDSQDQLIIKSWQNLLPNTQYNITVREETIDMYDRTFLDNDHTFTFKTGN